MEELNNLPGQNSEDGMTDKSAVSEKNNVQENSDSYTDEYDNYCPWEL